MEASPLDLNRFIRDVPDFPKPGIVFKDITPLLGDPGAFRHSVQALADPYRETPVDRVVGIESRGFMFGAAVALELGAGFAPARKPGKLPHETLSERYALEYGEDGLEMHADAILEGERVLVLDDLLATGGTAAATVNLIRRLGGDVLGVAVVVELALLDGRRRVDAAVHSLLRYA